MSHQPLIFWMAADSSGSSSSNDSRKARSVFNTRFQDELKEAEKVGQNAQTAPYSALLQDDWDITPQNVAELVALVSQTNTLMQSAKIAHDGSAASTENKERAERRIVAAIRRVQAGARTKFGSDKNQLKRFFVGTDLERNEEQLDDIGEAILQILQTETLPGVKAAQITELSDALGEWANFASEQENQDASGIGGNAQVRSNMARVNELRRQIQSAIDGEFPFIGKHEHPANEGARVTAREKFDLPVNHPMK